MDGCKSTLVVEVPDKKSGKFKPFEVENCGKTFIDNGSFVSDFGVLKTKDPLKAPTQAALFPSYYGILCDDEKVITAGFGWTDSPEDTVEVRTACYEIEEWQKNERIALKATGNRNCFLDSGGPIFCHSKGKLILLAVNSKIYPTDDTPPSREKCKKADHVIGDPVYKERLDHYRNLMKNPPAKPAERRSTKTRR
ncbi:MAG: hypothetical protein C5B49_11290 [Bdellovibrio sp.]|nr:MAG: hypothetical protein C5B49_11290 [Bdellovibrio sp.]